ncbi:MAG: 5'/3'-nucleotidase SurE [Bacillota bacterium]
METKTDGQRGDGPLILLTNDDGVFADGLAALRREGLAQGYRLAVVAPDRERSASGHAITLNHPLHVEQVAFSGGGEGWAVDGTPADCVKLAARAILDSPPSLVVSGINRGLNVGTDVYYSGTVSAAIEGVILGIPALAVSVAAHEGADYGPAAAIAWRLAAAVLAQGLPERTLLNINVPSLPMAELAGVAVTRMGVRRYRDMFDKRVDARGRTYYWMAGEVLEDDEPLGTDVRAIRDNLVSVTPIQLDLTHHGLAEAVSGWGLTLEG